MSDMPAIPKADLLIVDDIPENLRLLSNILRERGYKVRAAPTGALALQAARAQPPDLVLLDVMMPEMDGYDVCGQLKADDRTKDIPVIFLSALSETEDKVKAFSAGGVDYITKPFQAEEVLARVETHLSVRSLQRSLLQQVAELDAFAHTVAHDLKNPLNALLGYCGILQEELGDSTNQETTACVLAAEKIGYKMVAIIDGLLLLASVHKVESVDREPLDMANIVAGARERLVTLVDQHSPEILLPATWPTALGYAPWVEELWANLISNAIKYGGRPPRVELGADHVNCTSPATKVRFWVRDNGVGLSPEQQSHLFTEFSRLHQVEAEGHGLGLSIVHRIVEKLGGQVGVDSEVGQGSLFFFTLPQARFS